MCQCGDAVAARDAMRVGSLLRRPRRTDPIRIRVRARTVAAARWRWRGAAERSACSQTHCDHESRMPSAVRCWCSAGRAVVYETAARPLLSLCLFSFLFCFVFVFFFGFLPLASLPLAGIERWASPISHTHSRTQIVATALRFCTVLRCAAWTVAVGTR